MKPYHKHIGRRVARAHRHFTKYLYERDTIFATLWVFLFIVVLGSIPLNLYVLNPLKLALKDFEFNDMTYAKLDKAKNTPIDKNIVIVNIGHADREVLSMIIDKTAALKPKVMGLDALFYDAGPDPFQDSLLNEAFARNKNLIVANKLVLSGDEGDTITLDGNYFKSATKYGHANFFNEETSTTRYFEPFQKDYSGKSFQFFSTAIIESYDPKFYESLVKRHKAKEQINYERRVNQYQIVEYQDLLEGNVDSSVVQGKIALLGYVSENRYDIEDKKFTPMNEKFVGKSIPDMNGIVVHANIISMVLENNYIKKLPSWVNWLVAILICWLHMSFFVRYYLENHIWFHLVAKIAQVASAFIFAYLGIFLFDRYNIKLDMKLSLIVIIMAVDVIYFYEAFAVWMHKKFNYHTVFHQKHH